MPWSSILHYPLYLLTWPYYITLFRYTLQPLERIAAPQKDLQELSQCVQDFALGKAAELKYIGFAATINAALAVATFSWPRLEGAPWAAPALLYASLFFTIGALLTASQHVMFFHNMCPYTTDKIADQICDATRFNVYQTARVQFLSEWGRRKTRAVGKGDVEAPVKKTGLEDLDLALLHQRRINPGMILIWQFPMMLMAWAWIGYAVAIVVLICRPFLAAVNRDTDERKTAIFALTFAAFMFLCFLWSSWFTFMGSRRFRLVSSRGRGLPS